MFPRYPVIRIVDDSRPQAVVLPQLEAPVGHFFRGVHEQKLTPVGYLEALGSNWCGDHRHAMRGCFQNLDAGASACP